MGHPLAKTLGKGRESSPHIFNLKMRVRTSDGERVVELKEMTFDIDGPKE